ncbi:MAG: metallophosphoesterase [Clostridia bacterium]|nr:metallophosphoesterase [Clostridia bacterium]
MKIAIFADIHGNKEALIAILKDIEMQNIKDIICLGDVIGLGPNPKECMNLIIENNIKMVLGNHELYCLVGTHIDNTIEEGEENHHQWIKGQLNDKHFEYLSKCKLSLEEVYNDKKVLYEHFLLKNNSKNEFPYCNLDILKDNSINQFIDNLGYDLVFVGHEHKEFSINNKLYCVGTSGCRLDSKTRYIIFDTDKFNVETILVKYNREAFLDELLKYEYPERLFISKWFFGYEIDKKFT